jgi:hypothetical protein
VTGRACEHCASRLDVLASVDVTRLQDMPWLVQVLQCCKGIAGRSKACAFDTQRASKRQKPKIFRHQDCLAMLHMARYSGRVMMHNAKGNI